MLSQLAQQGSTLHHVIMTVVVEACAAWVVAGPCKQLRTCLKKCNYSPFTSFTTLTKQDEVILYFAFLFTNFLEKLLIYSVFLPLMIYYFTLNRIQTCLFAGIVGIGLNIFRHYDSNALRTKTQIALINVVFPFISYFAAARCLVLTGSIMYTLMPVFAVSYVYLNGFVYEYQLYQKYRKMKEN